MVTPTATSTPCEHSPGYAAILADPPWNFKNYAPPIDCSRHRHPSRHYRVMDVDAIKMLPVKHVAARDSHLFLWATSPFLPAAFDVMRAWGFRYSTIAFVWIKLNSKSAGLFWAEQDLHTGLGYTTRHNAEFVLLGRRGNPKRIAKDVREVIVAPRRKHSQKPTEIFSRIERYCAGPYLELFARECQPGWSAWGDELCP